MAEKFRVRFHLKLDGDIVNEYRFNDKVYLNISTTSYVTFDNLNIPINERGMDSSVMITNKSIFSTITSMNKMKNNLYENDIFAYDNGKLITYADEVKKSFTAKAGMLLMAPVVKKLWKRFNYEQYGGSPLLGVNGAVIKAHGRSKSPAILSAISVARNFILENGNELISRDL